MQAIYKHNQISSNCKVAPGQLWTKGILQLIKLIQISPPTRTATICDTQKSNWCFCTSLDMLGENNFWSKLCLKTSIFFIYLLGKNKKQKVSSGWEVVTVEILEVANRYLQWPNTLQHECYLNTLISEFPCRRRYDCSKHLPILMVFDHIQRITKFLSTRWLYRHNHEF